MEILLFTVLLLMAFAVLSAAAIEWGVDTRNEFDDPSAPAIGAY